MDWTDKVVLITGASSGIGRVLALKLARRGARIGLLARGSEAPAGGEAATGNSAAEQRRVQPSPRLQAVADEIESQAAAQEESRSRQTVLLPADVRNYEQVRAAADELRRQFGHVDVLIANAGATAVTAAPDLNPEEIADLFNVNVIGAVNSAAAVLPDMVKRGRGQLVAISSLAAYRGHPKAAAYSASKAAMSSFFESLRLDLIGTGVDVTIIHPGFIRTPFTAGRKSRLPFIMDVDRAVNKIINAIEKRKTSYAFPWQLATYVRAGMILPNSVYDKIAKKESFKE